jgi:isoquinoline 1-oxidoreductase beta subunit
VINPLGLQAQIEGGLQFGTSAALDESITVEGGVVQQVNFDSYPLLRLEASPSTAVSIVPSAAAPSGAGEIAVPPVAPAIANALFALTGQRRRRLPFAAGTTSAGS